MNDLQTMLQAIRNAFTLAGGTPGLSALFLAGLIALWNAKSEQKKDTELLFRYALVVLLLIISPPYLYLVGRLFTGYAINNMFLWLLPLTPVLLKVFSDAAGAVQNRGNRVAFVLAAAVLLVLAGTSSFQPQSWRMVDNHYYIPEDTLQVLQRIRQIRLERGQEEMVIWGPEQLMNYARIYDDGLLLVYGRDLWEGTPDSEMHQIYEAEAYNAHLAMGDAPVFQEHMGPMAAELGCDMVILEKAPFEEAQQPWPEMLGDYVLQEVLEKELIYVYRP